MVHEMAFGKEAVRMNRREFLGHIGFGAMGATALAAGGSGGRALGADAASRDAGGGESGAGKPNFLVILVDDLGWGDLSSYGAADLKTPHIDRLIAQGMRFDLAYANCPVCSPTRAALLTGRYQDLVGVPGVIRHYRAGSWGNLIESVPLLPQVLKPAGYTSALVGKWHLGLEPPDTPMDRGFDHFHGFLGDMMEDYYTHRRGGHNYMRLGRQEIDPKGHATDLFTEWACAWLREQKPARPWCLYLAYNAPHVPTQPPPEWLERVKAREPGIDENRARLVALIEHMDHGIGQVLEALDETALAKDTLVVFTSDNGGETGFGARNGPLRDGKGTLYEGGIRVPMGVRWPGRVAPGSRSERIVLSMDILPTLCEAAGVAVKHEIDGASFLSTLLGKGGAAPQRDLFWGRREGGPFKGGAVYAIRRGDWKLLEPMPGKPLELYNLADDPLEQKDRAQTDRATFEALKKALDAQLARYAKVPWKPEGK